ncbi:MAG: selenium cofactor biosynthesis protein YqeC [Anaerolineaceae bacterium]
MNLKEALRASRKDKISFVGSGGKTTSLFQLARQFESPVIITTTTHLGGWQLQISDRHYVIARPEDLEKIKYDSVILLTGPTGSDQRTLNLSSEILEAIKRISENYNIPLLIEADGSKQLPIKAPSEKEPPIPLWTSAVCVVVGMSRLNYPLSSEYVHRAEFFKNITGLEYQQTITEEVITRYLKSSVGGLKNIPRSSRKYVLLNQIDDKPLYHAAQRIAEELIKDYDGILLGATGKYNDEPDKSIFSTVEKTAGIILAAGSSRRFEEKPKQLLPWQGQNFLQTIIKKALGAGLDPVIVITGASHEIVEQAISNLDVAIHHNESWEQGQSTSIKKALEKLPENIGRCIFLLADQPQIPIPLIQKLITHHNATHDKIVYPEVNGNRANPVLFDRDTFAELNQLKGDQGGRFIFDQFQCGTVDWEDPRILLDVDTEVDYLKLIKAYENEE